MTSFKDLGLSAPTLAALEKKGFTQPTEIQEKTIPLLLTTHKDVIAQAATGTGKTAAFGLPFIERLIEGSRYVQAIVLVPTRELAVQVAKEIDSLKGTKKLRTVAVYGGQSITGQISELRRGVDIVVGTPGRVMDHLNRGTMNLRAIKYAVLDEADEMLNMGFIEDIETILKQTAEERQLLLFSATMPSRIVNLAKKFMKEIERVHVEKTADTKILIEQVCYEVMYTDKLDALCRIIDIESDFYGIIFCKTKMDVDNVARGLTDRGYPAEVLHGDVVQNQREKILQRFKERKVKFLVATDVAARGVDVRDLTHVVNYALPNDTESYTHRIGRTGRAGKMGTAISLVAPTDRRALMNIERMTKTTLRRKKIPTADDVLDAKRNRIAESIQAIVTNDDLRHYTKLIETMFPEAEPRLAAAALLKHLFAKELGKAGLKESQEDNPNFKKPVATATHRAPHATAVKHLTPARPAHKPATGPKSPYAAGAMRKEFAAKKAFGAKTPGKPVNPKTGKPYGASEGKYTGRAGAPTERKPARAHKETPHFKGKSYGAKKPISKKK